MGLNWSKVAKMGLNWSKLAKLVKMSQICYYVIKTYCKMEAHYPKKMHMIWKETKFQNRVDTPATRMVLGTNNDNSIELKCLEGSAK